MELLNHLNKEILKRYKSTTIIQSMSHQLSEELRKIILNKYRNQRLNRLSKNYKFYDIYVSVYSYSSDYKLENVEIRFLFILDQKLDKKKSDVLEKIKNYWSKTHRNYDTNHIQKLSYDICFSMTIDELLRYNFNLTFDI
jgi:hypothetical protein